MNKLEQRSYDFDVKAEEAERGHILTGRPIVYGTRTNMGCFEEIIEPGALATTDLTDVRFLVNHDRSMIPLARSRRNNGNSTMQLSQDKDGLVLDWVDLDIENNAEARALYSAVKRGDISGMSFMFSVAKGGAEWEDVNTDHPVRRIRSISSIVEVSAVTFPAYKSTEINARSREALENARSVLESARQQGAISVETDEIKVAKAKLNFMIQI